MLYGGAVCVLLWAAWVVFGCQGLFGWARWGCVVYRAIWIMVLMIVTLWLLCGCAAAIN